MRTLRFIVDGQTLTKDTNCDFSDLVPGSDGFVTAEFSFSSEWNGFIKVAGFYSPLGVEYNPTMLEDGKSCIIPTEALAKRSFKIQMNGMKVENEKTIKFKTNKLSVYQEGGKI